ncbi:T9SS type B sorting domain-containing protein, partial [Flaviramulus aquimarinus]|uniref:T9SS type B sorting domain-containing protein n=1 Tax=Flaviramulus aquimarinus TaxID=1170456 RepID=UPI0031ED2D7D
TGTQPTAPTGLECWETATFNNMTCLWEVTGTQPTAPTGLECWETATFNNMTCLWEVTGTQPTTPTGLECWETATFNNTTCVWEVTGTQPTAPTGLECWETATFNNTTCLWEVTGTQPTAPTGLECWETATFNNTTCVWEVTGTQPTAPTGLECWETASFNNTTCLWEVTGTQPTAPTGLECWETATFNNTTCLWEVTGTQPTIPTAVNCWDDYQFNETLCTWENLGTQPVQPPVLDCRDTPIFNTSSCAWEVGIALPISEEDVTFCDEEILILEAQTNISNPSYVWSTGDISYEIAVHVSGTYTVEISGDNCSFETKSFNVSKLETPKIKAVVSDGNNIIVTTTNAGDFEYSIDGIIFQSSNIFSNVEGGFYTIFVKEINCDSIVTIEHLHFFIPRYFTPNGDGTHDTFSLSGIEYFSSSEVSIFDRYGKLIKFSRNSPFSWDGTFNNQNLPTNDYWYVIIIEGYKFTGSFTLKR